MLHVAETWTMTAATLNSLSLNGHAMIRWICNVKARDEVSSGSLLLKLGIQSLDAVRRLNEVVWTRRAQHRLDC